MSDPTTKVTCPGHGVSFATFICQHLVHGSGLGFYHGPDEADPRPDAWCADCDRILLEGGGEWNEQSEAHARVTLICAQCYDGVRQRNEVPFKRIRPNSRPTLEEDGWELASSLQQHHLHPNTFHLPSAHELDALHRGQMVKLLFSFPAQDEAGQAEIQTERMWVWVERKSGRRYIGRLTSTPTLSDRVRPLDKISFRREHIAAIAQPTGWESLRLLTKLWAQRLVGRKSKPVFRLSPRTENRVQ